jgi:hypothetical protein
MHLEFTIMQCRQRSASSLRPTNNVLPVSGNQENSAVICNPQVYCGICTTSLGNLRLCPRSLTVHTLVPTSDCVSSISVLLDLIHGPGPEL